MRVAAEAEDDLGVLARPHQRIVVTHLLRQRTEQRDRSVKSYRFSIRMLSAPSANARLRTSTGDQISLTAKKLPSFS